MRTSRLKSFSPIVFFSFPTFVISNLPHDCIIGIDLMAKFDCWVDCKNGMIYPFYSPMPWSYKSPHNTKKPTNSIHANISLSNKFDPLSIKNEQEAITHGDSAIKHVPNVHAINKNAVSSFAQPSLQKSAVSQKHAQKCNAKSDTFNVQNISQQCKTEFDPLNLQKINQQCRSEYDPVSYTHLTLPTICSV